MLVEQMPTIEQHIFRVLAHLAKSKSRTFQELSRTMWRMYKEN